MLTRSRGPLAIVAQPVGPIDARSTAWIIAQATRSTEPRKPARLDADRVERGSRRAIAVGEDRAGAPGAAGADSRCFRCAPPGYWCGRALAARRPTASLSAVGEISL